MSDEAATKEDIDHLRARVLALETSFRDVMKNAPPIAQERARLNRFLYEVSGLAIVALGAWFIYPPASALVVGGWMLTEIVTSRRCGQPRKDR